MSGGKVCRHFPNEYFTNTFRVHRLKHQQQRRKMRKFPAGLVYKCTIDLYPPKLETTGLLSRFRPKKRKNRQQQLLQSKHTNTTTRAGQDVVIPRLLKEFQDPLYDSNENNKPIDCPHFQSIIEHEQTNLQLNRKLVPATVTELELKMFETKASFLLWAKVFKSFCDFA